MPYYATAAFRADGRDIQPGERVPAEDWLTRHEMLAVGMIAHVPDVILGDADPHGLEFEMPPGVVDLAEVPGFDELLALAAEHGISQPAHVIDLRGHDWDSLVLVAAEHGIVAPTPELPDSPSPEGIAPAVREAVVVEVELPAELPAGRAALAELAGQLGLAVTGTGSGGYVKEADYVAEIEAERARRTAAAAG
jgi:hypothetical protein